MCQKHLESQREAQPAEPFGLYHSPAVDTATFEQGWHNGRMDELRRFRFKPGTLHCESQEVGCTCGNMYHRFKPGRDGWERNDIVLQPGQRIFIWPTKS